MIDGKTPLVLVTQRVDIFPDRSETRDSIDQKLLNFLLATGVLPIPISNTFISAEINLEIFCDRFKPDGIVLSGGGNLGEVKDRDETEVFLVNYAKVNNLPLLGICRGMQVLAQLHGVKVELISSHVNSRHRLIATKAENLIPKEVNSFHEYKLLTCPENFEVLAIAEDDSIEAIRHIKLPWLGLMWHPERESPFLESDLMMIKNLFSKK